MSGHFDISEVLPRGIMIGSALLLTVIQYENTFHQNLALVVVVIPILIALPYSHISLSFLSSRVPIIIVFMSLFIEEYSRSEMRHRRRWERAPSARRVLLDDLEVNHHALDDGLLLHINGGVGCHHRARRRYASSGPNQTRKARLGKRVMEGLDQRIVSLQERTVFPIGDARLISGPKPLRLWRFVSNITNVTIP
ncbi:hypothetical protein GGR52DRAFT_328507 [Hypoxylon sp. FL1284]|nr:hypothetical protein GGR52DRAFT_328507 [Hypoxylon sp. FL1284]